MPLSALQTPAASPDACPPEWTSSTSTLPGEFLTDSTQIPMDLVDVFRFTTAWIIVATNMCSLDVERREQSLSIDACHVVPRFSHFLRCV